MVNNIVTVVRQHLSLFKDFDGVYLFGSAMDNTNIAPNDIDILLIYSVLPDDLLGSLMLIRSKLKEKCGLPIDLTVLSECEEQDVNFLNRLHLFYKVK